MDRGVNRVPLFSDDADREHFSGLVNQVVRHVEEDRAIGMKESAATLKKERGRPWRGVSIAAQQPMAREVT
jgi:hypothetical protein